MQIPIFQNQQGAFLRTILGLLEKDFFAPNQVVMMIGEKEEMLIVACGNIRIMDESGQHTGRLTAGHSYADYTLFEDHIAHSQLFAESYCELWRLPRRSFKLAAEKHFKQSVNSPFLQSKTDSKSGSFLNADQRANSLSSMETSARLVKFAGKGSTLRKAFARKATSANLHKLIPVAIPITWQHPRSRFRFVWVRLEAFLLLVLLWEVPYQIAFQRGFGLFNDFDSYPHDGAIPISFQLTSYFCALVIELFFFADLVFRMFYFMSEAEATAIVEPTHVRTGQSLCLRSFQSKGAVFRRYRDSERLWNDFISNFPLPLLWDTVPKEWFTDGTVHWIRFVRLARLVRARTLRKKLKSIMVEHGFTPAQRLLVYIVVLTIALANLAGCVFFLVGDTADFRGGLPVDGVPFESITWQHCLESASIAGNCTWYMFDRSTFDIDGPYLRSLHWSIVLLSTVGYGDIVAFSTVECGVGCIWIFFGANICYYTSSALSSVIDQFNIAGLIKDERIEELNIALIGMPTVSDSTKQMIRAYYEIKWKLNGSTLSSDEMALRLPRSLGRELWWEMYSLAFKQCTLFADCDDHEMVRQLAQVTSSEIFLKNMVVASEGHLATDFFLIESGECECLLPFVKLSSDGSFRAKTLPRKTSYAAVRAAQMKADIAKLRPRATFAAPPSPVPLHIRLEKQRGSVFKSHTDIIRAQQANGSQRNFSSSPSIARPKVTNPPLRAIIPAAPAAHASPKPGKLRIVRDESLRRLSARTIPIPVLLLKRSDYFGEESLSPTPELYEVTIRVVTTAQIAVIRRKDFLEVTQRYPQQLAGVRARNQCQRLLDRSLLQSHRDNFITKRKIPKFFGTDKSLYVDSSKVTLETRGAFVLDPERRLARWWQRINRAIIVYNFFIITFRVAFLPRPKHLTMLVLTMFDYAMDVLLYLDVFLKWGHMGYMELGEKIMDPMIIRDRYRRSWLWWDCLSMLPIYYRGKYWYMTLARLPRLIRTGQLGGLAQELHTFIQENYLKGDTLLSSLFDLTKFFLIFVATAHYISCLYYLIGRLQLEMGFTERSWISVDPIIKQHPHSPTVHYMRAFYWCLSTVGLPSFCLTYDLLTQCAPVPVHGRLFR